MRTTVAPVGADELLEFRRPGVSDRQLRRLKGGRTPMEAQLDLHGNTAAQARRRISEFIGDCRARGKTRARIIHGRGRGSGDRGPVLKAAVNHHLRQAPAVLAFTSAPAWDGGAGAVYVLLARSGS